MSSAGADAGQLWELNPGPEYVRYGYPDGNYLTYARTPHKDKDMDKDKDKDKDCQDYDYDYDYDFGLYRFGNARDFPKQQLPKIRIVHGELMKKAVVIVKKQKQMEKQIEKQIEKQEDTKEEKEEKGEKDGGWELANLLGKGLLW